MPATPIATGEVQSVKGAKTPKACRKRRVGLVRVMAVRGIRWSLNPA
jgi:hypothetical protein